MTGSKVKPAIPTGCSFNLDATPIYLSIATIFLAHQRRPLVRPELTVLGVLMLTSKGAAGLEEDTPILPQPLAISEQPTCYPIADSR